MPVRSLGYLRIGVADLPAWERFTGEFLGLMPVAGENPDARYFRMDDYPPRLVLNPAGETALEAIGLEVGNVKELAALVERVEATGTKVRALDAVEAKDRKVTGGAAFDDPAGNHFEVFYGPIFDHTSAVLPTVSSFVTGDQGMGHLIVTAPDAPAVFEFYTETLGFVERNTMRLPGPPDAEGNPSFQTLWFLGCNPRHHTLGILPMPGPARIIHFMVEAATIDDVGRAIDRADKMEIPVMQTLGRHTNDRMVSFYVLSPDGIPVEFGYDGMRVGPDESTYEITEGAFWGHKFLNAPKL